MHRKEAGNPLLDRRRAAGSFAEAFKTVRTNVLFSSAEEGLRSLVVTSAGPGRRQEHRRSANLAIALAQAGQRVLLIDADMRRPRVHEIFDDARRSRACRTCSPATPRRARPSRSRRIPGLWLLPAGHIPPNPAELLGSPTLRRFPRRRSSEHFDWVVLDTPPVLVVADSIVVANKPPASCSSSARTRRTATPRATRSSSSTAANAHVIGSVLNRADIHRHSALLLVVLPQGVRALLRQELERPVRLLYLSPTAAMGGAERVLLDLLTMVREARPAWAIGLISGNDGPLIDDARALGVTTSILPFPRDFARLGDAGLGTPATWATFARHAVGGSVSTLRYIQQLRHAVVAFKPDVVHSNGIKIICLERLCVPRRAR